MATNVCKFGCDQSPRDSERAAYSISYKSYNAQRLGSGQQGWMDSSPDQAKGDDGSNRAEGNRCRSGHVIAKSSALELSSQVSQARFSPAEGGGSLVWEVCNL